MVGEPKKWQRSINLLSAVSACIAIYLDFTGHNLYLLFKPLTTILIVSLLFFAPKQGHPKFKLIMMVAFGFCLLGDILLLNPAYFVFGLIAFLLAHILFIVGFIKHKNFQFHWGSFVLLFAIGGFIFFWLKPDLGDFMIPVLIYVLVITCMAWQGIGLFLRDKGKAYSWIALAVILFMLSDTMLAVNKFKAPFAYSSVLILGTYWLSIGLLANATFKIVWDSKANSGNQA
ncbi:lysoplasmalogenase [Muricauda sp. CAU 1633]|uniref:lysoplasmalogenase n=1 Tax=Allomuricauda sp. CAU 1633 TaxID=2816036 RepID=UPI001A8D1087|nr:lysoplasmalogenase [Muricauda sp. CAU 1633]MBO0321129.1 lysoplasmalogenase [Muricauda sp. CAU 1633]